MDLGELGGDALLKIEEKVSGLYMSKDAIGDARMTVKIIGSGVNEKVIDNLKVGGIAEPMQSIKSVYTPNDVFIPFTSGGNLDMPVDSWLEVTTDVDANQNIQYFGKQDTFNAQGRLTYTEEFIGVKSNRSKVDTRSSMLLSLYDVDFADDKEIEIFYANGARIVTTLKELRLEALITNGVASVIANNANNPTALASIKLGQYGVTTLNVSDVNEIIIESDVKKSLYLFGESESLIIK